MIKVKFNDGTTKLYNNDDIVKHNDLWYIGVEDLRIGSRAGGKVVVDIERFNPILKFIVQLAECCCWCLAFYFAIVFLMLL